MRKKYIEFRDKIKKALQNEKKGLKWNQLQKKGNIKYSRPCYTWIQELENEIGLIRSRSGRNIYWRLKDE